MDLPHESLGVRLKPGDAHYGAYVGPPEDYDLIAAMSFNLLTSWLFGSNIHCLTCDAVRFESAAC